MPPLVDAETLARTYNHPSKDPWEAVQLYREVTKKPADWGSQRVASAINSDPSTEFEGISRGEIRAWVDNDSMPDAVRGIETARDLGWDDTEWTKTVQALATLVIGIYACGSITQRNYSPSWSPATTDTNTVITDALTQVGVGFHQVTRNNPGQADEIRPNSHATRLGRALTVAGTPIGNKNADGVAQLPAWIVDAPQKLKRTFALLFARERGSRREGKATLVIQADRPVRYFNDVAQLIHDVTGETATVTEYGVTISAAAVRALSVE